MVSNFIVYPFKLARKIRNAVINKLSNPICKLYLLGNGVSYKSVKSTGLPFIYASLKSTITIGENLIMNNTMLGCETGSVCKCRIKVTDGAKLYIGDNTGMSGINISCLNSITIKNNVTLGVGVHIYDTDFHSLNPQHRMDPVVDHCNTKSKPVIINNNVFIGAHSIILKGVEIGENSIIGAGSVVNKNVPANVIAAGNPCKVIKNIEV